MGIILRRSGLFRGILLVGGVLAVAALCVRFLLSSMNLSLRLQVSLLTNTYDYLDALYVILSQWRTLDATL